MNPQLLISIAVIFGLVATLLLIPLVKKIAVGNDIMAYPGGRRNHQEPVPLLGGLAIFLPLIFVFICLFISDFVGKTSTEKILYLKLISLFLGTCWILLLGTLDDMMKLNWKEKLGGQLIGVLILVWGGHTVGNTTVPFLGPVEFGFWGYVILGALVITITNAVNLIDGIDGLAGGVCLFAAIAGGIIAFFKQDLIASVLVFTLAGSLLGYLRHNFHPASIYMGDGGSLTLGFFLSVLATSNMATSPGQRSGTMSMLIGALLPFGVALIDVALAVARRWMSGRKIFLPDADHLHHRFMEVFGNPRLVVSIFYCFSAVFCVITVSMALSPESSLLLGSFCFVFLLFIACLTYVLRLYRVDQLSRIIKNRPDFKFLSSFHTFMKMRVRKARSLEELLRLMEAGVRDLDFDSVEVSVQGKWTRSWINQTLKHPDSSRERHTRTFRGSTITVTWVTPRHDCANYQEYLELVWYWFLNQSENKARQLVNRLNHHEAFLKYQDKVSSNKNKASA